MYLVSIHGRCVRFAALWAIALWAVTGPGTVSDAWACGGFFCQALPIDQAGEQIIFRQDGSTVTAIVLIQYTGEAEDFSWVLPVPGEPEITLASDMVFTPLELVTRPQFNLRFEGEPCAVFDLFQDDFDSAPSAEGGEGADEGVEILEELDVGPFAIQVVTSDDPAAMAAWLDENDYDLTERGEQLIAPYVEEGMNFVAMKLRQDQGVGDIQPIKLIYESDVPMIPIRLTAVAAVPDMGILVWMLGDARAVPLNYPHVEVNYTRLNWFQGSALAYADYQDRVTEAMNEVGGLGFATDYAGTDLDVLSALPDPVALQSEADRLAALDNGLDFYGSLVFSFLFPQPRVLEILRRNLPPPEGAGDEVYLDGFLLSETFGADALAEARGTILKELIESTVPPLEETLSVFDGMPYLTRLFTTLSPEEMSLDPIFSYNPDLA
ncbi:MAG: DUF2330 domain-containing protein, partial [Planctomycetota bacterium]